MVIRSLIAILVLSATGVYAALLRNAQPVVAEVPALESLPRELPGWYSQDFQSDEATARILAADGTLSRLFRRSDGAEVYLFIGYFAQQQVNAQIHSPRNCVPGGGWTVNSIKQRDLSVNGRKQSLAHMRTARQRASQEIYYWFSTQGKATSDEYALKLEQVKNSILRRPTNAAFIRYSSASADTSALFEVMAALDPPMRRMLGEVGLK